MCPKCRKPLTLVVSGGVPVLICHDCGTHVVTVDDSKQEQKPPVSPAKENAGERLFEEALEKYGADLPKPVHPMPYGTYSLDFGWSKEAVSVEIDGVAHRISPGGMSRDRRRNNLILLSGVKTLHFTPDMLREEPETCIMQLRMLLKRQYYTEQDRLVDTKAYSATTMTLTPS